MAIRFTRTRTQRLAQALRDIRAKTLDAIFSPVTTRLTDDEYFACRTRGDCLRTYLRRRPSPVTGG